MLRQSPLAAFSLCALALAGSLTAASPISLEERAGQVSCSSKVFTHSDSLRYGNYLTDFSSAPIIGQHCSAKGQQQVTLKTDGANTLSVNIRLCNSTHLGISEDTNQASFNSTNGGYVSFGKVFLADDESKCLQRHGTLPSSDPSTKTHLEIAPCSTIDDSRQARQFFSYQTKFGYLLPYIKGDSNGGNDLHLTLSSTSPQAILATRGDVKEDNGQPYQILV